MTVEAWNVDATVSSLAIDGEAEAGTTGIWKAFRRYEYIDTGSDSLRGRRRQTAVFGTDLSVFSESPIELGRPYGTIQSANASELVDCDPPVQIEVALDRLFVAAQEERFEPGMESEFSRGLERLLSDNSQALLESLRSRLRQAVGNNDALAEMLGWLGRLDQAAIRPRVFELLAAGLDHRSPLVRDAAANALADIGGPLPLFHIERALKKENVPELREDLQDLLFSLGPKGQGNA